MTRERIAALPADDWRKEKNTNYQEPLLSRNLKLVELLQDDRRPARQVARARWRSRGCCATRP